MTSTTTRALALLLLTTFADSGCGGGQTSPGTVPAPLADIEGTAEDAYDKALVSDFAAVAAGAASIDGAWRSFRAEAGSAGAAAEVVSQMDEAVSGLVSASATPTDAAVLARAANAISAPMDELFALYETAVPPAVLALDYLGREVVLDARQGTLADATRHIDAIEDTYGTVRPGLLAGGGERPAAEYEASIDAMRADVSTEDAAALETDANVGLELVDAMEGVFESNEEAD